MKGEMFVELLVSVSEGGEILRGKTPPSRAFGVQDTDKESGVGRENPSLIESHPHDVTITRDLVGGTKIEKAYEQRDEQIAIARREKSETEVQSRLFVSPSPRPREPRTRHIPCVRNPSHLRAQII